jgi:wyosine [tRNA(Phe)-imidazoG37] synthetase (radical SAM superfamily)
MKYRSCFFIEACALNFNGMINSDEPVITLCCERIENRPGIAFDETPEKTVSAFIDMCTDVIDQSKEASLLLTKGEKSPLQRCSECVNFKFGEWDTFDGIIKYVNLSMYPSPCQCKCSYCDKNESEKSRFSREEDSVYYDRLFELLEYADSQKLISPTAVWQVSCGEITIHPYKKRIMDLVKNRRTIYYTNCFIYDEDIAENLKTNPFSGINFSIDAGTPETWLAVKGVDNFDKVTDNLFKYASKCSFRSQITLKYIILPGINDNLDDILWIVEAMKELSLPTIMLARDTRVKYKLTEKEHEDLIRSTGAFLAVLEKNKLKCDMLSFSPAEREEIIAFAEKLLGGKV